MVMPFYSSSTTQNVVHRRRIFAQVTKPREHKILQCSAQRYVKICVLYGLHRTGQDCEERHTRKRCAVEVEAFILCKYAQFVMRMRHLRFLTFMVPCASFGMAKYKGLLKILENAVGANVAPLKSKL